MPSPTDYLGSAGRWRAAHCQGIEQALWERDEARAREQLARCMAELAADRTLTPDERRALDYLLLDYEHSIVDGFNDDETIGRHFPKTQQALLALAPVGPLSDVVQAVTLVSLIGSGTRRGYIHVAEPEFAALWGRIPEEVRTPNLWYYVTAWAFHRKELAYIEQALEQQTVETTGWLDDYYWLRTNLMYQLLSGKAAALDIAKTLQSYQHPWQLLDFRNVFLHRCEQAGLMDDTLYALLAERQAQLAAAELTSPARNATTMRAVKQE
jgi:hypothetical protein